MSTSLAVRCQLRLVFASALVFGCVSAVWAAPSSKPSASRSKRRPLTNAEKVRRNKMLERRAAERRKALEKLIYSYAKKLKEPADKARKYRGSSKDRKEEARRAIAKFEIMKSYYEAYHGMVSAYETGNDEVLEQNELKMEELEERYTAELDEDFPNFAGYLDKAEAAEQNKSKSGRSG